MTSTARSHIRRRLTLPTAGTITKGSSVKYVVFPTSDAMTCTGNVVKGSCIPGVQNINNTYSFAQTSNLAISKDGKTLKNVCAYIRFYAPENSGSYTTYKSVTVKTLTPGEYLSGTGDIDFSKTVPSFTITDGIDSVKASTKGASSAKFRVSGLMSVKRDVWAW